MTTLQDSEILTHVGPGTPMGELMRHYWLPALKSSELVRDGDPVRLMLLGEKLVAFRDTEGRVGVMDQRCPHRCASLFLGRNEEGGIRCVYHGWKFDVSGNCLDQPNLPPHQQFMDKVRAKAYRAAERNGIVYVYMGEAAKAPALPDIPATHIPEDQISITFVLRNCNWLQGLEGDIDTSHLNFLHYGSLGGEDFAPTDPTRWGAVHRDPEYKVDDTEIGTIYGAYRPAEKGQIYWRIAHFLFPCWTLAPFIAFEHYRIARAWVPLDDTHMMFVMIGPKDGAGSGPRATACSRTLSDWFGRFPPPGADARERLPGRPVGPAHPVLHGDRGHPYPGSGGDREHGADHRPQFRESRGERPHGRDDAAPSSGRGQGARGKGHDPARLRRCRGLWPRAGRVLPRSGIASMARCLSPTDCRRPRNRSTRGGGIARSQ